MILGAQGAVIAQPAVVPEPTKLVQIVIAPGDASDAPLMMRLIELMQTLPVRTTLERHPDVATWRRQPRSAQPFAVVLLDLSNAASVQIEIEAMDEGALRSVLERQVPLGDRGLAEAEREVIATIVASNVEALLARTPPTRTQDGGQSSTAPEGASNDPAQDAWEEPARAGTPRETAAPQDDVTVETAALLDTPTLHEDEPAHPSSSMETPLHQLSAGYELMRWGSDVWLHGPRLAADLGLRLSHGSVVGLRGEGWVTWSQMVSGDVADLRIMAFALRLMGRYALRLSSRLGLEVATGIAAQTHWTTAANLHDHGVRAVRNARTSLAWRNQVGLTWRFATAVQATAAFAMDLDPIRSEQGIQYADRFVVTHRSASLRPATLLAFGWAW